MATVLLASTALGAGEGVAVAHFLCKTLPNIARKFPQILAGFT